MLRPLLILVFVFVGTQVFGQEVSGYVFDAKTQKPVVGASVYYDGSSVGTITDLDGKFSINLVYRNNATLVIRHLGYKTQKIPNPQIGEDLKILLREEVQSLNEIVLTSDPFSRKQKMRVFRLEFLGDTRGGRNSEIVNENDVKLYFNTYHNTLTAYSSVPVIVENEYLGYRIYFEIEEFKIYFKQRSLDRLDNIHQTLYDGSTQFFDVSQGDAKYKKRRENAYLGSSMHFMRACWYGHLEKQSFTIKKKFRSIPLAEFYEVKDTLNALKSVRFLKDRFVIYHKKKSMYRSTLTINEPGEVYSLDRYGNYAPFQELIFGGYMADFRIGDMLPMDYGL